MRATPPTIFGTSLLLPSNIPLVAGFVLLPDWRGATAHCQGLHTLGPTHSSAHCELVPVQGSLKPCDNFPTPHSRRAWPAISAHRLSMSPPDSLALANNQDSSPGFR